jgi:hypothetical protein
MHQKYTAKFLLFTLWALVLSYPLILYPTSHIPLGDEPVGTVPLFNLWTLQWNIEQLTQGFPRFWDAPIFAPTRGTFAFSETQPLSALLAAPLWLGFGSPALAYNALVVLFLTLNGWFAYWLLRSWGLSVWPALAAGLLAQSIPFVSQEMGVLQLVALFGPLWSLLFLDRFLSAENPSPATMFGLALGTPVTFFTCIYYGLFSVLFLPLALVASFRRRHLDRRRLRQLAATGLLVLLLTGPFLLAQRRAILVYEFRRSEQSVSAQSAHLRDYGRFLDHNLLYGRLLGLGSGPGQRLFPGLGLLGLAVLGIWGPGRKRARLYLGLATVLALVLSFGLRFGPGLIQPYQWLRTTVPGYAQLRSPFRFAALVQLHLALSAGFGLQSLWQLVVRSRARGPAQPASGRSAVHLRRKFRTSGLTAATFALVLVTGLALFESLALPLPLLPVPNIAANTPWQRWLNDRAQRPVVVLLPFAPSGQVADFEQTVRWMLAGLHVEADMVNGYSGFFPSYHAQLREQMRTFPAEDSLRLLHEQDVDYVVVFYALTSAPTPTDVGQHLPLLFDDKLNQVAIYGLR